MSSLDGFFNKRREGQTQILQFDTRNRLQGSVMILPDDTACVKIEIRQPR
jgi:hypothetical protein